MAVYSLIEVLTQYTGTYLARAIPEHVTCVFDVSVTTETEPCPEHEGHSHSEPYVRIGLWFDFKGPTGGAGERVPVVVSGLVDYWMVNDGDMGPVKHALDELWSEAQFINQMAEVRLRLGDALDEEGPFLEDDEDPLEDTVEWAESVESDTDRDA